MKLLCSFMALALLGQCTACAPLDRSAFAPQQADEPLVVIDAGHGGMDGGAVSGNGEITESRVNLEITRRLALLLLFCGSQVALTRTDDNDLASPDVTTVRERKVSDLKNRAAAINSAGAAVLISIHQNSLPSNPKVHGAQVFFNAVSGSDQLAQTTQNALNQVINPGNEKVSKAIDSTIYLMKEVHCPAILVECGFLSNDAESARLCTDTHQKQLSLAIAAGYLQSINEGIL